MSIRTSSLRRGLVRTGAAGIVAVAAMGAWLPAASAAPATTITLDPGYVELSLRPHENLGRLGVAAPVTADTFQYVPAAYGGTVTITVPPQFVDGGSVEAQLALAPDRTSAATRTYSTGAALPADQLTMTALGGGQYEIDLPADDATNGPEGRLQLVGFEAPGGVDVVLVEPLTYVLSLTGGGPAAVSLAPQAVAMGCAPDGSGTARGCPEVTLTVGTTARITLPVASRLSQLGLTNLTSSAMPVLTPVQNATEWPPRQVTTSFVILPPFDDPRALNISLEGFPSPVGKYLMTIVSADTSPANLVTVTVLPVNVVAAPNAGLRSNTGWGEIDEPAGSGSAPLVALGGSMILVAGLTGVVAVRRRRIPAAE